MASFVSIFGNQLLQGSDTVETETALKDAEAVGVYFSAHWCPPCRGFTPVLSQTYKDMKAAGKGFEVVFVSSDRDTAQFNEYYGEMPWLALPFEDRDQKNKLSKKFGVQGIPMLIIVGKDGKVINTDGRSAVMKDKKGNNFPWVPPTLFELMADQGLPVWRNDGTEVDTATLKGKTFGIYFSAHWCPPCKAFTPILVNAYNNLKEANKDFEIIFSSMDRSQSQYDEYFGSMPWLSFGFQDDRAQSLAEKYEVQGIPCLIIFDEEGNVINSEAVGAVRNDPEGKKFPWAPPDVDQLGNASNSALNSSVCVIALLPSGASEEDTNAIVGAMEAAAKARKEANKDKIFFFHDKMDSPLAGRICQLCSVQTSSALLILDLPTFYRYPEENITAEAIGNYLEFWESGALEAERLG